MKIQRKQFLNEKGNLTNTSIRLLEIDYSSLEDLQEAFKIIKTQLCNVRADTTISLAKRKRLVFDSCNEILKTDISSLYDDLELDESKDYYVYAHCDPGFKIAINKEGKSTFAASLGLQYMPFYIGKGKGTRSTDLNRNEMHRKVRQKIQKFGKDIIVFKIAENLTEKEALILESKLIDIFGLMSFKGRLVNLDEGIAVKERRQKYQKSLDNLSEFYKNSVDLSEKVG